MGRAAKIIGKLTLKQYVFVAGILKGESATQAAMRAYEVKGVHVAKVIASENLTKPNIREEIASVLRSQGVSLDVIAKNLTDVAKSKPKKVSAEVVLKANIELAKIFNLYAVN